MKVSDNLIITNEDNMDLMSRYPDNYFDLAIVDLEFCIGASKPSVLIAYGSKNVKILKNSSIKGKFIQL